MEQHKKIKKLEDQPQKVKHQTNRNSRKGEEIKQKRGNYQKINTSTFPGTEGHESLDCLDQHRAHYLSFPDQIHICNLKIFLFYTGVELINKVVLVSIVQQSDSVIRIHVSILFQILFPFRFLQNIEQSSLCYTVGPYWLSILNIAVCTYQSQTPNLSLSSSW